MKTKITMLMVALMALFVLSSCSETKESYLKDFNRFVEKVQAEYKDYSEADWEDADQKFKELTGSRYEKISSKFTFDEVLELAKLKASYAALQLKRGASAIEREIDKIIEKSNKKFDKDEFPKIDGSLDKR